MFSKIFIERPIFATVISIVIVLVGSIALVTLPIARYPDIAPPTIEVTANYPGANAKTVADTVATPIEQEVNGVENMAYMSSTSTADGAMTLSVTFEVGANLDMANVLVQNRVSTAQAKLPEETVRQGINVKKKSAETTLFLCLFSPNETKNDLFLNNYATLYLRDELARIDGVGDVRIFGAGDYSMRIWLDPDKLKSLELTTNDVVVAIRDQNVQVAAGVIGQPPAPEGTAFQYTVNTLGRLSDPAQFEQIVIRSGREGSLVRVKDVARVELGSKSYDVAAQINGLPTCAIAVYQLPGANAIKIVDGVRSKMDQLRRSFPGYDEASGESPELEFLIAYDSTDVIRASIKEVIETLFITLVLVVFTVYIFLQNIRATLIPTLTIPVSLIGTFAVMSALGYSINQLTLFGLVLVIGIVVDDAIVVVENVTRHLDEGETDPKKAALKAMQEVTGPVIATTLVLLSVFIPTVFLGGITGQLFRQFAVTISIATIFSSINALTMSPALCGVLLRPSTNKKKFIAFRAFDWALDRTTSIYVGTVKVVLRVAAIGLIFFIALIGVAGYGFSILPTGFVPQEDEGWALCNVQLPDGASLDRTKAIIDRIGAEIGEMDGIVDVLSIAGYSMLDNAMQSSSGSLIVTFEPWDDRNDPALHHTAIIQKINQRMYQVQEALTVSFPPPSLPGIGTAGGFAMQLQDRSGANLEMLESVANEFVEDGNTQSALSNMRTGFRANVPQLFVNIDREQVRSLGIPLQDIFSTLQSYLGSTFVNYFNLFGRIYQVKVQAESTYRASAEDIEGLEVRAPNGGTIPLGAVMEVNEVFGAQVVTHHNLYASAKISGAPSPGYTSGQAMAILENMADQKLPSSMGFEWTELSYQEKKASGQAAIIFLFSVLLVYLVLAAQYESWSIPISVCMSVPTALLGAVAGLMIRKLDNNVYTQIGVVLLIGLAAKTSILIVEFAKVKREEGMSIVDAAVTASRLRFRAVLMTAFSFILGMIPLLVASGAGAESRKVLGTAVFSGMLVATVVSVVAIPMLYRIIQGISESVMGGPRVATKLDDDAPAQGAPAE